MGRWRYVNLTILLAFGVFLYMSLYTARSPLAPKPIGDIVYQFQSVGPCQGRVGHAAMLNVGERIAIQVQFDPDCTTELLSAGVVIASNEPTSFTVDHVSSVRGTPNRLTASLPVPQNACAPEARIWLGVKGLTRGLSWTSWPISDTAKPIGGC